MFNNLFLRMTAHKGLLSLFCLAAIAAANGDDSIEPQDIAQNLNGLQKVEALNLPASEPTLPTNNSPTDETRIVEAATNETKSATVKAAPAPLKRFSGWVLTEFWNNYLRGQQSPFLGAPLGLANVNLHLDEKTSIQFYAENFLPGTPGIEPWQPNMGHVAVTSRQGNYAYTFGAGSERSNKWDSPDNVNGFRGNLDQRAFDRDQLWFKLEDEKGRASYQFNIGKDPYNGKTAAEVIYSKNWDTGYGILTVGSYKNGTAYYRYSQDYGKQWNFSGDCGINSLGQGGIANINYKLPNNLRLHATYWNIDYNTVWGGENISQGAGIGFSWGTRLDINKNVSFYFNTGVTYNQSFNKFNTRPLDRSGTQVQLGGALVFWINP